MKVLSASKRLIFYLTYTYGVVYGIVVRNLKLL